LPTKEITNVLVNTYIDPEKHSQSPVLDIQGRNKVYLESKGEVKTIESRGFKFQHLYFTTDEEIKEGNWYYSVTLNNIFKATNKMLPIFGGEKIIASTDPELNSNQIEPYDTSKPYGIEFAQIPQSFIEEYCKAGGIDEVLVEGEEIMFPLKERWGIIEREFVQTQFHKVYLCHRVQSDCYLAQGQ
jgi:hypothetical protein